jgi:GNAT superfamily N-acetyltransferase
VWQSVDGSIRIEVVESRGGLRTATLDDVAAIARVNVLSWRETYPGLLPRSYLRSLDVDQLTSRWRDLIRWQQPTQVTMVVEQDGEVVGFANAGPARQRPPAHQGELYAIYLLARAQGRGWGRALVQAQAAHLLGHGMPRMQIWALRDNGPARRFYEHLGGTLLAERDLVMDGVRAKEVCYGWDDLGPLLASRAAQ